MPRPTNARNARPASPISTPVRNSAIPKAQPIPARPAKTVSWEMIAKRAYEISQSPQAKSEIENWLRAERELRGR